MEVILLERIEKLGQMGEVVNVKPGYARNYLLPQKKAMRATEENRKYFEAQRAQLEAVNLERRSEAEAVATKLDGLTVMMIRQAGDAGQLYGSVNARDISSAVSEAGFTIARQQVKLLHPIKTVGIHTVRVDLHPEVSVAVRANVARSAEEAEIQAKTGAAVVSGDDEPQAETEELASVEEAAAPADDAPVAEPDAADAETSEEPDQIP